jgi:hypothetical protein
MRQIMSMFVQKSSLALAAVCLMIVASAAAQTGGQYELSWSTIDGGGGTSSGGQYVLRGTIGQPDAAYSAGGDYEVLGGFWPSGALCIVDFEHFARFAMYWLYTDDCPADLFDDDMVNFEDLREFVDLWLCYCPYGWPLR